MSSEMGSMVPSGLPNLEKGPPSKRSDGHYARVWLRLLSKKLEISQYGEKGGVKAMYVHFDRYFEENPDRTLDEEMLSMYNELVEANESNDWPDWSLKRGDAEAGRQSYRKEQNQQLPQVDDNTRKSADHTSSTVDKRPELVISASSRGQPSNSRAPIAPKKYQTLNAEDEMDSFVPAETAGVSPETDGVSTSITDSHGYVSTQEEDERDVMQYMDWGEESSDEDHMVEGHNRAAAIGIKGHEPPKPERSGTWRLKFEGLHPSDPRTIS